MSGGGLSVFQVLPFRGSAIFIGCVWKILSKPQPNPMLWLMRMVELVVVRDIVAIMGVFIGLTYYIFNVRQQQENRRSQLFLSMYQRFDNPLLMKTVIDSRDFVGMSFKEWNEKYGPSGDREAYTSWVCLQNAIQGIGYMVREGKVDPKTVAGLMGAIIVVNWERNEPFIKGLREQLQMPDVWRGCEELYHEIRKL